MYELDGKRRRWDMISSHSSVGVIIYHTELDALIVVRQFRPPAYASAMMLAEEAGEPKPPLSVGFTYELCAGIVDKKKSLAQIAAEEVKEECGFEVATEKLQWVTQYVSAVGTGGSRHDMYYAEVDESMRVGKGGGLENTVRWVNLRSYCKLEEGGKARISCGLLPELPKAPRATRSMPHWPHLASCPESFEDFADVVFVVGNERLPAHSQYLASYSKLMQALMRDSPTFSKDNPLVLDQQLQAFAREDIQTFLDHPSSCARL
ncbi:hypothetical protein WJX79_006080 [Trebouxia sp. C0005]